FFCSILPPPPISTLFPYTTLFRSHTSLGIAANRFGLAKFEGQTSPDLTSAAYWKARPRGFEPVDHAMAGDEARRYEAGLDAFARSEEHTSELQSRGHLVCRLLLEK